jgi:hypothetical protein
MNTSPPILCHVGGPDGCVFFPATFGSRRANDAFTNYRAVGLRLVIAVRHSASTSGARQIIRAASAHPISPSIGGRDDDV